MMGVTDSAGRTNKGAAWAYLKASLVAALGDEAARIVLDGYYARLSAEYRDRRRIKAAQELEDLRRQRSQDGISVSEARRLDRMIVHRERLLAG